MLCYFAVGDTEKMKRGFSKLLTIPIHGMAEDDEDEDQVRRPPPPSTSSSSTALGREGGRR